ncbi:metal ABC transporter substrate-binding protein [Nocardioides taihuensis]|uniref:Metal ABC transporter substrate-binding protein n=1 Tax=Nocardioides taihuensis TaxID=1835606 RepID=A0ABW0BLF8_9ACTN
MQLHVRALTLAATGALALAASGCAALSEEPDGVSVAAAFYPLAFVAEEVGGDRVDVSLLTQPGTEPHDLELTIRETAELAGADLVVYESGFQPAVDDGVEQNAAGEVLDAADVADLQPLQDGDGTDPHFWLDPLRMADLADAVADRLAEVDPAGADEYAANAAELRRELTRLDAAYERGLADCERDTVVVSHDAFGYLARYGLAFAPVAGLSPEAEPTAADLARLQDLVRDEGITTVFSERLASPRLTAALAQDVGVETAVLDPIEGRDEETADEDYLSLMRENLAALEEANGCA